MEVGGGGREAEGGWGEGERPRRRSEWVTLWTRTEWKRLGSSGGFEGMKSPEGGGEDAIEEREGWRTRGRTQRECEGWVGKHREYSCGGVDVSRGLLELPQSLVGPLVTQPSSMSVMT